MEVLLDLLLTRRTVALVDEEQGDEDDKDDYMDNEGLGYAMYTVTEVSTYSR